MNIVYIGAFRLPNLDAAAPRVLNNAKALREIGCKVSFVSWGGSYREEDLCEDGKYRVCGFEYLISGDLPLRGSFKERIITKLTRGQKSVELLKEIETPDLIILYNAGNSFTKKMLNYCVKNNIKLANDINEWYDNSEIHITDVYSNYINMTRTQYKVRNKIVISSFLDNYYHNSNNILVPPLCDKSEHKWNIEIEDERVKPYNGLTLIYAGIPAKKDCLHIVINTVNKLINEGVLIRFIILGVTKDYYIKRYSRLLNDLNLHENIIFIGRVAQDLIPAYYKKADFMVLLREQNRKTMAGFPTKFAESYIAGIPIITNATSDIPKYLKDGETGFLVKCNDSEGLLSELRNKVLSLSRLQLEQMKTNVVKSNYVFDWHSYIDKFKIFIENLK